jgi:UDP-2,3-diacylglucosamine pyrophosphatase LpxH
VTPILWGIGVAYGFAIAGILYLLKQSLGEPLYEALLEWWERHLRPDPVEERLARPQEITRGETFVISDLHIDTWHKLPSIDGKSREQHFREFVRTIKSSALELYINGDLVDMPPHPGEEWTSPEGVHLRQSLLPKYASIFAELADFNAGGEPTMTMYMAGNHDMAASGVRYLLHHLYDLLPGAKLPFQTVWYGHFIISLPYTADPPKAPFRYFLEHGHYHDPVLVLYLLQFVVGVVSSNLKAAMDSLTVGGQRRTSPTSMPPPPGVRVEARREEKETFERRVVKWRWRWKARRQLGRVSRLAIRAGQEPLDGILMGHTHTPDFYVFRLGGVRGKVYVNSGDWSGDTGHATYVVITEDGLVYLYDWHSGSAPHHRRRYEQQQRLGQVS